MQVIVKKSFEYQGKILGVGDEVAVPAPLGRAWQMMRRADFKAEVAVPATDDEPRTKRQYRRRDMRVED